MRLLRLAVRILGWLLTPFVAWAASHLGGLLGSVLAGRVSSPRAGLAVTILTAAIVGFGGLLAWLKFLRRSPELQRVLHVAEDATPDTSEFLGEEPDHPA